MTEEEYEKEFKEKFEKEEARYMESIINNKTIVKEITTTYIIDFEYSSMSFIMDLAKQLGLTILKKELEISCQFTAECPNKNKEEFELKLKNKLLKFKSI